MDTSNKAAMRLDEVVVHSLTARDRSPDAAHSLEPTYGSDSGCQ